MSAIWRLLLSSMIMWSLPKMGPGEPGKREPGVRAGIQANLMSPPALVICWISVGHGAAGCVTGEIAELDEDRNMREGGYLSRGKVSEATRFKLDNPLNFAS
jgi:hypothetical protein